MVNVSGTGTEKSLNVDPTDLQDLWAQRLIVGGLVKRAKTQSRILARILILMNFVIMMITVTRKVTQRNDRLHHSQ